MKIEVICRLCLEEGEMKSIFTTNCLSSHKMSCAEAIIKISEIRVNENDGLPEHICKKCLSKLKAAYKFKILCEESYFKLNNQINNKLNAEVKNDTTVASENLLAEKSDAVCDIFDQDAELNECSGNDYENQSDTGNDNLLRNDLSPIAKKKRIEKDKNDQDLINSEKSENKNSKCDKNFQSDYILKKHKEIHTDVKPYFCEICQKNFRSEYKHKILHSSDRQFQCEICAKIFHRVASLRMHLLAHRNELPFQCTFVGCNKAFPQNNRLQLHLKVHTDERNFICQYCSHAARDKQQLTVHIRYFHTKEKNFLCGTCGKAFVSPQARYYHTKRHENIRNHHCPHCDKSFVFAFGLQEHLFTHTGEKRFSCSICEAKFSRKAHKEKHESRLHGIKIPVKKRNS